VAFGFLQVWC